LKITAEFVTSAASASDFPHDGLPELAVVGRSNVGKSSLINALVRQRVARTSAAPGKTRLANIFRATRGAGAPFYLIDLPGFGFARGGSEGFDELVQTVFRRDVAAVMLVDTRHPGLDNDLAAWRWVSQAACGAALVGTKIDKLPRGQRIRALAEMESVFQNSVLPVSAVTGEGLDELWKLIDRLANSPNPQPGSRPNRPPNQMPRHQPKGTAPRTRTLKDREP
jgi:GTP-binding protein